MGSRGTLVVEKEETIMLFPERNPNPKTSDKPTGVALTAAGGGKPAVDSSGSTGSAGPVGLPGPGAAGPVSRGYTEEMEHFAYCIRMFQKATDKSEQEKWRLTPRCHGKVAMADAIIALTSNIAMRQHKARSNSRTPGSTRSRATCPTRTWCQPTQTGRRSCDRHPPDLPAKLGRQLSFRYFLWILILRRQRKAA